MPVTSAGGWPSLVICPSRLRAVPAAIRTGVPAAIARSLAWRLPTASRLVVTMHESIPGQLPAARILTAVGAGTPS